MEDACRLLSSPEFMNAYNTFSKYVDWPIKIRPCTEIWTGRSELCHTVLRQSDKIAELQLKLVKVPVINRRVQAHVLPVCNTRSQQTEADRKSVV